MLALALAAATHGHVRMIYTAGQVGPIRNANSPTGDGRSSVNRACGGANTFGANGKGTVQDGDTVTFTINYAAGHRSANNEFRMAYACAGGAPATLEAPAATLTAAANACTGKASGTASTYPVPAPNAIVPGGYELTCTLPTKNVATTTECTISVLDQRQWGGCVDVDVLAATASLPPAPPPSPYVSNQGEYAFTQEGSVDTSGPTFTCCSLAAGSLSVPAHMMGAPTLVANINNARATGCRTSALETAPIGASFLVNQPLTMALEAGTTNKYTATIPATSAAMGNQPFEFVVEQGRLSFTNVGAAQPIICDGVAALVGAPGGAIGDGTVNQGPQETFFKIDVVVNAASVESITQTQTLAMRQAVATRLGVDVSRVTLTLTAASVRVKMEVTYPSADGANAATQVMATELASATSATIFFTSANVQVVTTPQLEVSASSGNATDSFGAWGATAVVLMILMAGGGIVIYLRRNSPPPPPKGMYAREVAMPNAAAGYPPPPAMPPPPPSAPLPPGYQEVVDPGSGATYFYNAKTGESTWTRPTHL